MLYKYKRFDPHNTCVIYLIYYYPYTLYRYLLNKKIANRYLVYEIRLSNNRNTKTHNYDGVRAFFNFFYFLPNVLCSCALRLHVVIAVYLITYILRRWSTSFGGVQL